MKLRVVVTGHRPDKLGGYSDFAREQLDFFATQALQRHLQKLARVEEILVLTGMAQGWDQAIAQGCVHHKIPFVAVVPCTGQESLWPVPARQRYTRLLERACEARYEPGGPYATWKIQERNIYMIDQVRAGTDDRVLALWNGTRGGTANACGYALQVGVRLVNVWSEWQEYLQRTA